MACDLSSFHIQSAWRSRTIDGHSVKIADATTAHRRLSGVVYILDGVFQGFTGSDEAALKWAAETIATRARVTDPAYLATERRVKQAERSIRKQSK